MSEEKKAVEKELVFNDKSNLLEQHVYKYQLQDVQQPNLFRQLFDYESVPKVAFNWRNVPIHMPDEIWVTDTTFRDGQQSRSPFTTQQIKDLYRLQSKLGGPKGIIRQSEFFVYTENDRRAVVECMEMGLNFPEVTTWIRASEKDFDLVKELGVQETGILVSCSDYHIFNKMGLTRAQAMEKYLSVVKMALDRGIKPRCHMEDITRADFYGFVLPFANELKKLSDQSGIPIKIRACDTMGYGISYPGVALPRSVPGIIYGLRHYSDFPCEWLEWHGHNDFYKVVTNSTTAWLYGCSAVNCSLLGIGERTGNCPTEAMLMEYCSLRGSNDGMDLSVITEIADYFENEIGYDIPIRTPFVGQAFNSTRAGIHADGMLKDEEIYNIFDTGKILNRPPTVMIDSHSGSAGIAHWVNSYFRLPDAAKVDKRSETVEACKERVDAEYLDGRTTVMSNNELETILASIDADFYEKAKQYKYKKAQ